MACIVFHMTSTLTPQQAALIFDTAAPQNTRTVVTTASWDDIAPGMFVVESYNGYRSYCRFTGRTRRQWGMDCPTIERYDVETVATDEGVVMGVVGARIPGTWAIRPDRVSEVVTPA